MYVARQKLLFNNQSTRYLHYLFRSLHDKTDIAHEHLLPEDECKVFERSLPNIMSKVLRSNNNYGHSEVSRKIKRITEYNVYGGKNIRGELILFTYKKLETPNMIANNLETARVLAWGAEMTHSYFMIMDDMQDGAVVRRGKPCWHLLPEVGQQVMNDASLLRSFLNDMLHHHIGEKQIYPQIVNLFNKAFLYTSIGQHLDMNTLKEEFTVQRYNTIVNYKTSYYTFKFPIFVAMALANRLDSEICQLVDEICTDMGRLFQIQDDFIDCFGETSLTGKYSTDIQEGKCSWLAVSALERCTEKQKLVFLACYGSKQPAHVERIKRLYEQLKLPTVYAEYENQLHKDLMGKVNNLPVDFDKSIFIKLIDSIYNRSK